MAAKRCYENFNYYKNSMQYRPPPSRYGKKTAKKKKVKEKAITPKIPMYAV